MEGLVVFVLCALATFVCCFIVENTFHNNTITIGLGCAMGLTSGFLCAVDARRQQEGNGKDEELG
jgi:hypothetical protein